ncbi:MAG: N-6 DNA methylase, partial [Candidatus Cloacimonetes bacterium]|nr:N-6 DNA methylase [Candidatus Cloacimonadota bacterium]
MSSSNFNQTRSEDSYIFHDIIPVFTHYGYPQAGDHQNLKIKGDIKIRIGSRMLSPDVVYYASGIPLLLVEDKKPNQSEEEARGQAFSYLKNFPVERYSKDNIRPKYLATTVGRKIRVYKYHYEIDERGELIETLVPLPKIPTYEELKRQYGVVEEEKPKLTTDAFKDLFYELASALDVSEENKITPELILKAVRLIYEYLKDSRNYVSRVPYVELDDHPDRQQWIRNVLSQYVWQNSLGVSLASQLRIEILRSFQGADLNQYITPKSVIDFMVGLCEISSEDKVLDFECGSGGFIAAAISQGVKVENVLGIDIADLPYYVAKTYLALYFGITGEEVENIPIRLDDGLYFWSDDWGVVIGNPAGSSQYDPQGELDDLEKVLENLERDLDQNGRDDPFSEYNFSVQQAVRSCKVGGRICLILPEGLFAN